MRRIKSGVVIAVEIVDDADADVDADADAS